MMEIIVPLRVVPGVQQSRIVMVVLDHQVDVAAGRRPRRDHAAQLFEHRRRAVVENHLGRIEPQAVETVCVEPPARALDEERAHVVGRVVDGRSPRRLKAIGEECGRVAVQVVAFGPEVVVHHVQKHGQSAAVRGVDERRQLLGPAVTRGRCVRQHAVVPPVAVARPLRERHELDRRHTEFDEIVEPLDRAAVRAAGRERADVQFVEHHLVPGPPAPIGDRPAKPRRIDEFAQPVDAFGLKTRCRIRYDGSLAVDAKPVARSRLGGRVAALEPAAAARRQGTASLTRSVTDEHFDAPRRGREEPKRRPFRGCGRPKAIGCSFDHAGIRRLRLRT